MKNFFDKIKSEVKFARAGEGHRLTEDTRRLPTPTPSSSGSGSSQGNKRPQQQSQRSAAEAAASRFSAAQARDKKVIHGRAFRRDDSSSSTSSTQQEEPQPRSNSPSHRDEDSVKFYSPFMPDTYLTSSQFNLHLEECLGQLLDGDGINASCMMIRNLTLNSSRVDVACQTLYKVVGNIVQNPDEEKYRKIRCSNKTFSEKVLPVKGTREFIKAIGFEEVEIDNDQNERDTFFMMKQDNLDIDKLKRAVKTLEEVKPVEKQLYRDAKIIEPGKLSPQTSRAAQDTDSFYKISAAELKRQQLERSKEIELSKQLRTRAMREASSKPKTHYEFTTIRVKFPDRRILQGDFASRETIGDLKRFIHENVNSDAAVFSLISNLGNCFNDDDLTLEKAQLTPRALLNLKWDEQIQHDVYQNTGVKLGLK